MRQAWHVWSARAVQYVVYLKKGMCAFPNFVQFSDSFVPTCPNSEAGDLSCLSIISVHVFFAAMYCSAICLQWLLTHILGTFFRAKSVHFLVLTLLVCISIRI